MALELSLEKPDGASWGFRLTGGAEYDVPLTVIKVAEKSVAERGGLQVNDIIVRVNDTPTAGLTHPQAHDVLLAAGNSLILAIRRGEACCFVRQEDENNEEVCCIMQQCMENENSVQNISETVHQFDLANVVEKKTSFESNVIQTKHISDEKEIAISVSESTSTTATSASQLDGRKWSTFLQKPKNPKPIKVDPNAASKAPPYRVKIVKQKKKQPTTGNIPQSDESAENVIEENLSESIEISQEKTITDEGEEITYRAEITQEEEIEVEIDNENADIIETIEEEVEEAAGEIQDEKIDKEEEEEETLDKSVEEKLAEVQRQLEALAHLPTTIQSTINAVTLQLASIVGLKKQQQVENDNVSGTQSEPENDYTEQNITEESVIEDQEAEEENQNEAEINIEIEQQQEEPEPESEIVEETEEEKELKRIEQELLEKQQKDLEAFKQRHIEQKRLKPIDRPIILPGGRRWSQPDDACPAAVRHPKMSDEKISNTIESYSETLVGRTKGLTNGMSHGRGLMPKSQSTDGRVINFLKYQPPPKNLDYLQKSEVYRLVHDMEPPVRGICTRDEKILAEQDYYMAQ